MDMDMDMVTDQCNMHGVGRRVASVAASSRREGSDPIEESRCAARRSPWRAPAREKLAPCARATAALSGSPPPGHTA